MGGFLRCDCTDFGHIGPARAQLALFEEDGVPMCVLSFAIMGWMTSAAGGPATFSAAEIRSDFQQLYRELEDAHFDLHRHRDKAETAAKFQSMYASLDNTPMSEPEARVFFQRFVAFGRVAHAYVDLPDDDYRGHVSAGGGVWPLEVSVTEEGVFAAQEAFGLARGDKITHIDEEPFSDLVDRQLALVSADTSALRRSLLERSFPYHVWLDRGPVEQFVLRVRSAGGQTRVVVLPARPEEQNPGRGADPDRRARILRGGIAYLQPGPFLQLEDPDELYDNSGFVAFVDSAFEMFIASSCHALILDLRGNPGGDHSFSDPMIAWFAHRPFAFASRFAVRSSAQAEASNRARLLEHPELAHGPAGLLAKGYETTPHGQTFDIDLPKHPPREGTRFRGPVVVLVDRYSYSNAVNVAAIVQDYGFGVVVGEATADLATTYGALESFTLHHTGIAVSFPKALIVRPNGSREPAGVTPDTVVPWTGFSHDEDALTHVVELLRSRPAS